MLTCAKSHQEADEHGVEHDAGDEGEHADRDRFPHGSSHVGSSSISSAICFQIGAARMEPKRLPAFTCGLLRITIMVNWGLVAA